MSTKFVYIARLCEWFELSTTDIENLIDAIPAHDLRNVSEFCRVDPPALGEKESKPRPYEAVESKEAWKWRGIGSSEAKLIGEAIVQRNSYITNLFNVHDEILGKNIPGLDPDDNCEIRECEIRHINENYDLRLTVYGKFLDVLCLNKDDAIRCIKSGPYILKLSASADISVPSTEPVLPPSEPVGFDTIEKPDSENSIIVQWEALLKTGRLSAADKTAVLLLLEKLRGKTHKEAYTAVFPNDRVASPIEAVSKRLSRIQRIAREHGLPMPKWNNNR